MARTRFTDVHPILPVSNLPDALAHYRRLGFRVRPYADGDDYGFAERGAAGVHLTFQPHSFYPDDAIAVVYLDVDDADSLYQEWTQPGIGGETSIPADMPWGMREGIHTDPDGNVIRYGSPIHRHTPSDAQLREESDS
jgi:catechol 2,3-dioxygenase-like lactoylglutathione lyase family enzyme